MRRLAGIVPLFAFLLAPSATASGRSLLSASARPRTSRLLDRVAPQSPWRGRFVEDVGQVLDGEVEVTQRPGWNPEAIEAVPVAGGHAWLVLWRSMPRRRWLAPELWQRPEGGEPRKLWPQEDLSFHQARVRLDLGGRRPVLEVEHDVVAESFHEDPLRKVQRFALGRGGGRRVSRRYAEATNAAQTLNLIADLVAEGEPDEAARRAAALPGSPEIAARVQAILGRADGGEVREQARRQLSELAQTSGPTDAARIAANALLNMRMQDLETPEEPR